MIWEGDAVRTNIGYFLRTITLLKTAEGGGIKVSDGKSCI